MRTIQEWQDDVRKAVLRKGGFRFSLAHGQARDIGTDTGTGWQLYSGPADCLTVAALVGAADGVLACDRGRGQFTTCGIAWPGQILYVRDVPFDDLPTWSQDLVNLRLCAEVLEQIHGSGTNTAADLWVEYRSRMERRVAREALRQDEEPRHE